MTKDAARAIITLLETDDWNVGGYTVDHIATGISLWIANGKACLALYSGTGTNDHPPFFMRRKMWRAVEQMKSRMLRKKIYDSMERQILEGFDDRLNRR